MKRRRRFLRDEVIAPWATLAVILSVWWLGARVLGGEAAPRRVALPVETESSRTVVAHDAPLAGSPPRADTPTSDLPAAAAEATATADAAPAIRLDGDLGELADRRLLVPVAGIERRALRSSFFDQRGGGRLHEAMDILAPRGTPVIAVEDGKIAKMFTSAAGGLTIYQFDADERFCYYYAHLDSYAPDLTDGQRVTRGQVLGFVGTTGNAPANTPHLHFAIFKLGPERRWWDGAPLDPFLVLR